MRKTDADRIADIERFATLAEHIVSGGRDAFMASNIDAEVLRQAALRSVECVYLALSELSDDFAAEKDELGFNELRGMRNRIAHLYNDIDAEYLWNALTDDVSSVVSLLRPRRSVTFMSPSSARQWFCAPKPKLS
ncbi:MAG: DUF86 domain-containing protein [Propionibacteriaceae bacterium]|jgi:uncharacterized protein with HEPN domain|nr:DUF86 domain-containing protein [Propionibacteriaceae bacterium]